MTKVYSSAPKDGLRNCVGKEIMKKDIKQCVAVLRPLDVPSTLWKYGRVLSHSAVLCTTKKDHILIEYTSTNLVHINKIGGFKEEKSEIGPCFEYRGFIFHYISPFQVPKKRITIRDFALKMADYMCCKPYDVFTHNCHQARFFTMKYYGMKSHDPCNIKYNILFQGIADYFTNYNSMKVKENLGFTDATSAYITDNKKDMNNVNKITQHCSSTNVFINKEVEAIENEIKQKKDKKNGKSSSPKREHKELSNISQKRCSSTQNISKLDNNSAIISSNLFARNIHLKTQQTDSSSILFLFDRHKYSESSSNLFKTFKTRKNTSSTNDGINQQITSLRRCKSNNYIPTIKNPYRHQHQNQQQQQNSESYTVTSTTNSESSSPYNKIPHPASKKDKKVNKQNKKEQSNKNRYKIFRFLKIKKHHDDKAIHHSASDNLPQLDSFPHSSNKQKKR